MNELQPLKNIDQINEVGNFLKEKGDKYYIMYLIGIQTGMNISDIMKLTVNEMYQIVGMQKSPKFSTIYINKELLSVIEAYIENNDMDRDDYLIPSRVCDENNRPKALGRVEAYRMIKKAGEACNIENLGPQSLRKTFGYHFYMQTGDLYMLMKVLGIESVQNVLKYIGIDEDFNQKRIAELEKFHLLSL